MRISDWSSDVCSSDLDPNLNAASINGVRIPSPESDVRSVALDTIPSELVESIEIKKTLTPDMDADTIGATIEINTTSALDRKKPFVARSEEHKSELHSLMRISYAVFSLTNKMT